MKDDQKYIDSIDFESPDYLRPVEIKQDVRQMTERKRVNEILKSKQFRDELEEVVVDKMKTSIHDQASIKALQQISQLVLPQAKLKHGPLFPRNAISPINDMDPSSDALEKLIKCKLAACYRLIHIFKWSQPTLPTFISAKYGHDKFLISSKSSPELTSSNSLILVSDDLSKPLQNKPASLDDTALVIHSATYLARPDVRSVVFIRSPSAIQLSSKGQPLFPLSPSAVSMGTVANVQLNESSDIQEQLQDAFRKADKVGLLVKGLGALVVGGSIEEAFLNSRKMMQAIEVQLKINSLSTDHVSVLDGGAQKKLMERAAKRNHGREEALFESFMRRLENEGHKTGYMFRESLFNRLEKNDKINCEVEVPPTVVAIGYGDEERVQPNKSFTEYLNSPNAYKREEVEVAQGTPYQKKITKWVAESSPSGTTFKVETPSQFVPLNTDPKELKQVVKQIRKEYYDENITSGPKSKILEGPSWQEANKIREGNTGKETIITVGTSSRGIIQKGHEGLGDLYKVYYPPNPFDGVGEEEVEEYKKEVETKDFSINHEEEKKQKQKLGQGDAEEVVLVPAPDGRLISTEERFQGLKVGNDGNKTTVTSIENDPEQNIMMVTRTTTEIEHEQVSSKPSTTSRFSKDASLPNSPAKSVSSGDTPGVTSGTEVGVEGEKKKKKKGFRMPSFSKKKDKSK